MAATCELDRSVTEDNLLEQDRPNAFQMAISAPIWIEYDPSIPGDVDGNVDDDGLVSFADLVIILSQWGPCDLQSPCEVDLNHDDLVGMADLLQVISKL